MSAPAAINERIALPLLLSACVAVAECAGRVIRDVTAGGHLYAVDKAANCESVASGCDAADPQTLADRRAQLVIVHTLRRLFPGLHVVGEEGEMSLSSDPIASDLVSDLCDSPTWRRHAASLAFPPSIPDAPLSSTVVWVDPLDGTKEYTLGHLDSVTTLIGISVRGTPVAGIIHHPFGCNGAGRSVFGAIGAGITGLNSNRLGHVGRRYIAVSKSRLDGATASLLSAMGAQQTLRIGGSGRKVLAVLDGEADAYVYPGAATSKWDICACEALLVASGGRLTDTGGGGGTRTRRGWNLQIQEVRRGILGHFGMIWDELGHFCALL